MEYEFVDEENNRRIEIHIPSDANMELETLCKSVVDFLEFEKKYFPNWVGVDLVTETWMVMPELDLVLSSNNPWQFQIYSPTINIFSDFCAM